MQESVVLNMGLPWLWAGLVGKPIQNATHQCVFRVGNPI